MRSEQSLPDGMRASIQSPASTVAVNRTSWMRYALS
ncbi:unnamed protein product [Tuber melanosporum]|uniref:(Perigord truffle) hypothetical protein n=1 Tax=Tuber melanosporum (strain Mel28) TaxID=656061 RepID=D5GE71_TUBMM|nr:uncharacterized protein GSTUM_00006405001 [Tuber melanosporum]CAZ82814.1 unnamed protein product [Tuber melanosporum]